MPDPEAAQPGVKAATDVASQDGSGVQAELVERLVDIVPVVGEREARKPQIIGAHRADGRLHADLARHFKRHVGTTPGRFARPR
jgi:hypothetical protein